jgi:hypothetical protein
MTELRTIYTSNSPVSCHILKGRLESDGLTCFIKDENIIWAHPFWAVAVGGTKLQVPMDQLELALKEIELIKQEKLPDENGEYDIAVIFKNETERQNEIIKIKNNIRKDSSLLNGPYNFNSSWLSQNEIEELVNSEKEFQKLSEKKFNFNWTQFWYELFDFNRSIFNYLRTKPVEFYIDKELVDNYFKQEKVNKITCPNCKSDNLKYGYAIDDEWDVYYLVLCLFFYSPFPLIRKKYHCFDCGFNFRINDDEKN